MTPYENFDLRVERSGAGYLASVTDSPSGETDAEFDLADTAPGFQALLPVPSELRTVERNRSMLPAAPAQFDAQAAKDFGLWLYDKVFAGTVRQCLDASLTLAGTRGAGLRIRLRLGGVPELGNLPWECLYDSQRSRYLSLSTDILLVRYTELPQPNPVLAVKPPLTILAMIASPDGFPRLDVEREWAQMRAAFDTLEQAGQVVVERLEAATLERLRRRLRQEDCHVLHFIGHGDFDERTRAGEVLLEDDEGRARHVPGEQLAELMRSPGAPKLIVLNACKGAHAAMTNSLTSTAQQLVLQGTPAVIAMQSSITDRAAVAFSAEFYRAVADGYSVDAALVHGRQAIRDASTEFEWTVPVLFMRSRDGRLFDIAQLSDEERRRNRAASLVRLADAATDREEWATAIEKLELLVQLEPQNAEATRKLEKAQRTRRAMVLFGHGQDTYRASRWAEAIESFTQTMELAGNYKGTTLGLLASAQLKLQRAESGQPQDSARLAASGPDTRLQQVVSVLAQRKIVVFLGTEANLCGRPVGVGAQPGRYLPSGRELAAKLADMHGYPWLDREDLVRVAQYVEVTNAAGTLYDSVREQLGVDYPPTPLHLLLASLRGSLHARGYSPPTQVIVTANYDDALEATFEKAREPYEVLSYELDERDELQRGTFRHRYRDGDEVIREPNEYIDVPREAGTLIVKIHGALDRRDPTTDHYLITEDQYVKYSSLLPSLLPLGLHTLLTDAHYLFLGYSLSDWNLRVFLNAVWPRWKPRRYPAWVVPGPLAVDNKFWGGRGVTLFETDLDQFVEALAKLLQALPPRGVLG